MVFVKGIGSLLLTLLVFTIFSLKCPKGGKAMGGLANAAIVSFLVEAIFKYICGDFIGIDLLGRVGEAAGSMGGPAAAALVGLAMGTNPLFVIASAIAVRGFGILPGFLCAYLLHFLVKPMDKLPEGIDAIVGSLVSAVFAFSLVSVISPVVDTVLSLIGNAITAATNQSPVIMGLLLGGLFKVICTAPLSSMALTAMLGLTGLPMGIAAVACLGGTFTNGVVFHRMGLGDKTRCIAVMLEPLTQADIISRNPIIVYSGSFLGGMFSGLIGALFGIVNNAPGTAAPIPGLLAPFAFNPPLTVALAMAFAAAAGTVAGLVASTVFKRLGLKANLAQTI